MKYRYRSPVVVAACLLMVSLHVQAATATANVTATGTMQNPTACVVSAPASIDFGTLNTKQVHSQPITVGATCDNGVPYSLSSSYSVPITLGGVTFYVTPLYADNTPVANAPYAGVGNGSVQNYSHKLQLHSNASVTSPVPEGAVGTFNVNIAYTITY